MKKNYLPISNSSKSDSIENSSSSVQVTKNTIIARF